MTNDKIQELAEELVTLDPVNDKARIRSIKGEICEYELGALKNQGGKAYFPLLGGLNMSLPFDDFCDILTDALLGVLGNYKPDRAKFVTALMFIVKKRVMDYFAKNKKILSNETSYEQRRDELGDAGEIPYETDFTDKIFNNPYESETEFETYCRIAPFIADKKSSELHRQKKERGFFEGFFTFDGTSLIKNNTFTKDEITDKNGLLFPVMELAVLEYLLTGTFTHMRDIADNEVKDEKRFAQRNLTMQVCYSITKPTVVSRNKMYKEFVKGLRERKPPVKSDSNLAQPAR